MKGLIKGLEIVIISKMLLRVGVGREPAKILKESIILDLSFMQFWSSIT